MNTSILNIENQEFINNNLDTNITKLLLKKHLGISSDIKELIEQIESKIRCKKKLPTWFKTSNIYFPNKLNIEQTSSEITASYKSKLIEGKSLIDLTGGFGVDCYYFSQYFESVTHCEIDKNLSAIASHNYKKLNALNVKCVNDDGIVFLQNSNQKFDWIYVDPSRRHEFKGKVFFLNDCLPNIPDSLNILFEKSNHLLIKTSPLLDISIGIKELKYVKTIHVVSINNEVKELLWELENGFEKAIEIKAVNIRKDYMNVFNFVLKDEATINVHYNLPLSYLYEPNNAIMKAGGFNSISSKFKIEKLHKHSHLYTSNNNFDFPGRCFKILKVIDYNKKSLKNLDILKANITTRNFPETVQAIRKKFNIADGGSIYLFFTTNKNNERIVIVCEKLKNESNTC